MVSVLLHGGFKDPHKINSEILLICFLLSISSKPNAVTMGLLWVMPLFLLRLRYKGEGNINTSHFNLDLHRSDAMPGSIVDTQLLDLC